MKNLLKLSHVFLLIPILILILLNGCAHHSYRASMDTPPYMISNNPEASESNYKMGMNYYLGIGGPQNYEQAYAYFYKAATYGNPYAENQLGYMYSSGLGVARNYPLALQWYQRSAEHGLASAQYTLGMMYAKGIGTTPNRALARMWFQKAADRGFFPARNALKTV